MFRSFWDERFLFECNDKSNQIRLQIMDRRKANKKSPTNPPLTETVYADVSIPFAYVTSTIYKQDVRITPQYPESIIRIEVSREKNKLPKVLKIVDSSKGFIGIFFFEIKYFFSLSVSLVFFFFALFLDTYVGELFLLPLFCHKK